MRGWTRGQWALRLVVLAGPLLALSAQGLTGDGPRTVTVLLTAALAAGFARYPESPAGTVAFVLVLASWWDGGAGAVEPSALLAAAALVASHVAALLTSYGPDDVPLDRALTLLWLRRGAAVLLAAPAVWLLAQGLRDQPEQAGVWVAGVVAVIGAVLFAIVAGRDREPA
jgi:hypothetical protein